MERRYNERIAHLQEKYAPNNACWGCGPANPDGYISGVSKKRRSRRAMETREKNRSVEEF